MCNMPCIGYRPGKQGLRKVEALRGVHRELFQLSVGSFRWGGELPDGLNSWWIERYLYDVGTIAVFPFKGGIGVLPAWPTGRQDMYYRPTEYTVVGLGYQDRFDVNDIVLIHNNSSWTGSWQMVEEYSTVINEINTTDRANIKQLRVPYIFTADEESSNSIKETQIRADQGDICVIATKEISALLKEGYNSIKTGVTYLGDDLKKHRDDIYNECLTKLGFDNIPVSKKERLITDEARSNDQQIKFFRDDRLRNRSEPLKMVKEKFGVTISVEWVGGNTDGLDGQWDNDNNPV